MLAYSTMNRNIIWNSAPEPGYATQAPSALLLLKAIENGWEVVNVETVPSWDQLGFINLVTIEKAAEVGRIRSLLILPKSPLVEKILEYHRHKITLA